MATAHVPLPKMPPRSCDLSEENNHPELARKTVETALKNSPCNAAAEAELVVLKRKTPTGIYELEL